MKSTITILASLFLIASVSGQTSRVLVIGIDGCRADALRTADAPNIHALLDHAIYSYDALTRFPTWSGPGWSSMCTGVWADKHGVLDNTFAGSNYATYPHFIKRSETYNPNLRSTSIVHWSPINTQINTLCDIKVNVPTDLEVKDSAVASLTNGDPDILFVAFDDVDHAGHLFGFSPTIPEYMASINITDNYVGEILAALQSRPNFIAENWLVLLTPDHGGNLQGHGGASFEERNIFFIAWKPGMTPQELAKDSTVFLQTNGLQFNGTDQYLIPNSSAPFEFGENQDFSIEMRLRYDSLSGDAAFISNKDWDSGLNKGWVLSTPFSDQTHWKVNISDGTTRLDVTGGPIGDGHWHHITVTFDRDGLMSLYEDGNPIGQTDMSAIGNVDTGLPVILGQDGTLAYPFFFKGSMAEVRLWNTVLSPETVALYACGSLPVDHPNAANLLAYWKMDDGSGNTITNTVIGGTDCLMAGAPADWNAPAGNIICPDFSQTPRIVDIAVTALTHLCVPIDSTWGLDGRSFVEACTVVNTSEPNDANNWLEITPNPISTQVNLRLTQKQLNAAASVFIYSMQGYLLTELSIENGSTQVSLAGIPSGMYLVKVVAQDGSVAMRQLCKI